MATLGKSPCRTSPEQFPTILGCSSIAALLLEQRLRYGDASCRRKWRRFFGVLELTLGKLSFRSFICRQKTSAPHRAMKTTEDVGLQTMN